MSPKTLIRSIRDNFDLNLQSVELTETALASVQLCLKKAFVSAISEAISEDWVHDEGLETQKIDIPVVNLSGDSSKPSDG